MDTMKVMGLGAGISFVISAWSSVKALVWRFLNLFLQDITMDQCLSDSVVSYLVKHYQKVGLYDRVYSTYLAHIRTENHQGTVAFEVFGSNSLIFRKGLCVIYYKTATSQPNTSTNNNYGTPQTKNGYLMFLRGTLNIDKLIEDANNEYNQMVWAVNTDEEEKRRRYFVRYLPDMDKDQKVKDDRYKPNWQHQGKYRIIKYKPQDIGLGDDDSKKMLDSLFFPDEILSVIDEIKIWRKSQEIYRDMGRPWKRAWLLYGPAGTGKTALASAFAHDLDMPIFIYNLSELYNMEFMREWKKMMAYAPCMALIEDIDNVFHGRKNISNDDDFSFGRAWAKIGNEPQQTNQQQSGQHPQDEMTSRFGSRLNFDVFLNCLDGINRCEGLFTIITTNHIEHIDPALGQPVEMEDGSVNFTSSRPGRIDRAIKLGAMEPYVKKKMAKHILGRFPAEFEKMLIDIETRPMVETPAQFAHRCSDIALRTFWSQEEKKIRKPGFLVEANTRLQLIGESDDRKVICTRRPELSYKESQH